MNELIRDILKPSMRGTWTRLALYMALAALAVVVPELDKMTPDKFASMGWPQQLAFWLKPVGAMLMTWRAFLDQSLGEARSLDEPEDK